MSILKDLWEIWQLLRQHQRMTKDIEEDFRNFNELYNRIFNPPPTISKMENFMNNLLYPVDVQLSIFHQLLTYEHLLEDGCYLDIQKYAPDQMMRVTLWEKAKPHEIPQDDPNKCWHVHRPHLFNLMRIHTVKELDEAVARWWESIPQECKK